VSELPTGWGSVNLFEICRPRQWKTISTRDLLPSGYVVYGANGEIGFYSEYTHENPTVMITCRGATCGNIHISKPFSYINGNAMALDDLNESVSGLRYVNYFLRSRGFEDVISGSAQPQITGEGLRKVSIPIAPLPEQKRIADKLDAVLARVDACRDRLDCIPTILKRFRQSVLAAATSGKLTEDWRAELDAEYGDNWRTLALVDICARITDGEHISPQKTEDGVPLLTAKNVTARGVDFSNTHFVAPKDAQIFWKRCHPEPGDILVCSRGTIGRCAEVPEAPPFCLMGTVILLKPNHEMVVPRYLLFALSAPAVQKSMQEASGATAVSALYLRDIALLEMAVPGIKEQAEIVRRVEALFACADRLEARYTAARAQVEKLTPATLSKAFRGELVPQDPNDEPASVLLARIHAQHNEPRAGKPSRSRREPG